MKMRGGLGKGLGSLLSREDIYEASSQGFFQCPVEKIRPNPEQPRKKIDGNSLDELARSIREKGILQPLVVREAAHGYELIAGERRWRAARKVGLSAVPVVIKDVNSNELLELALIENIQRKDLNPLEEALAYSKLIDGLGLTRTQVARRVGKDRSTVANCLRILHLPDYIQDDLAQERMTMGHARALLMVRDKKKQRELRNAIVEKGLSVREAELLARRFSRPGRTKENNMDENPEITRLCEDLTCSLGARVRIVPTSKGGRIEIRCDSPENLERIIARLQRENA